MIVRIVYVTIAAMEKAVSMTHSECVFVASVIQHAKRIHPIILPSVACTAPLHFSTYLINGTEKCYQT